MLSNSVVERQVSVESITSDDFRRTFRNHPGGVAVITADAGDGPVGLTATSVSSVNADPPTLVFSASHLSSSTPVLMAADTVVVHLLSVGQVDLAKLCATSGIDRFADRSMWSRLPTGEPYFTSANSWLRCRIIERVRLAGATLIIAEALQASPERFDGEAQDARALVYHDRTWHALGDASRL